MRRVQAQHELEEAAREFEAELERSYRRIVSRVTRGERPMAPHDVRQIVVFFGTARKLAIVVGEDTATVRRWMRRGADGHDAAVLRRLVREVIRLRELADAERQRALELARQHSTGERHRVTSVRTYRRTGVAYYYPRPGYTLDVYADAWRLGSRYPWWSATLMLVAWAPQTQDTMDGRRAYGNVMRAGGIAGDVYIDVPITASNKRTLAGVRREIERQLRVWPSRYYIIQSLELVNFRRTTRREQREWYHRRERQRRKEGI